jgi:glycine/serine hydroxymethyltransferase
MKNVAEFIVRVLDEIKEASLPENTEERSKFIKEFRQQMQENENIAQVKKEVTEFANKFPLPGVDI